MSWPEELSCPACTLLIQEAVLLPCCQEGVCKRCAQTLLKSNNNNCWVKGCERKDIDKQDILPYTALRTQVEQYLEDRKRLKAEEEARRTIVNNVLTSAPPLADLAVRDVDRKPAADVEHPENANKDIDLKPTASHKGFKHPADSTEDCLEQAVAGPSTTSAESLPDVVKKEKKKKVCKLCEGVGHKSRNCPFNCRNCGKFGHLGTRCPKVVCIYCGENGHIGTVCHHLKGVKTEPPGPLKTKTEPADILQPSSNLQNGDSQTDKKPLLQSPKPTLPSSGNSEYFEDSIDIKVNIDEIENISAQIDSAADGKDKLGSSPIVRDHQSGELNKNAGSLELCLDKEETENQNASRDPRIRNKRKLDSSDKNIEGNTKKLAIEANNNEHSVPQQVNSMETEDTCICLSTSNLLLYKPAEVCTSCPLYFLKSAQTINTDFYPEVCGAITILAKICCPEGKSMTHISVFSEEKSDLSSGSILHRYGLAKEGTVRPVINGNLVFVTLIKNTLTVALPGDRFHVKEGEFIGCCQEISNNIYNINVEQVEFNIIDAFVNSVDKKITKLEANSFTNVNLGLRGVNGNPKLHHPLISFKKFAFDIKDRMNISLIEKRITLQERDNLKITLNNTSSKVIEIPHQSRFGYFISLESSEHAKELLEENQIKTNVSHPLHLEIIEQDSSEICTIDKNTTKTTLSSHSPVLEPSHNDVNELPQSITEKQLEKIVSCTASKNILFESRNEGLIEKANEIADRLENDILHSKRSKELIVIISINNLNDDGAKCITVNIRGEQKVFYTMPQLQNLNEKTNDSNKIDYCDTCIELVMAWIDEKQIEHIITVSNTAVLLPSRKQCFSFFGLIDEFSCDQIVKKTIGRFGILEETCSENQRKVLLEYDVNSSALCMWINGTMSGDNKAYGEFVSNTKVLNEDNLKETTRSLPLGNYQIITMESEIISEGNFKQFLQLGAYSLGSNETKFFRSIFPKHMDDYREKNSEMENLLKSLRLVDHLNTRQICVHENAHRYSINEYSCCMEEKIALEDLINFLKLQKQTQRDGIVLVFYSDDKTFPLLLSKMEFYGMSHKFLSLVTGYTSISSILRKKQQDTIDLETFTTRTLGKLWPETQPFLDLISYFMWECLCYIINGVPNFENFIKSFCKPLVSNAQVDMEYNKDDVFNELTYIELETAFTKNKSTRIELQHTGITVLSDSEGSVDSDSGVFFIEEIPNKVTQNTPKKRKKKKKRNKTEKLIINKSIPVCSCYNTACRNTSVICGDHPSYNLVAMADLTVPPFKYITFIAHLETIEEPGTISSINIYSKYINDCVVQQSQNVVNDKVFVTLYNNTQLLQSVIKGSHCAVANEVRPPGTAIQDEIYESPIYNSAHLPRIAKASCALLLRPFETQLISCLIQPLVKTATLVNVHPMGMSNCSLMKNVLTVQVGSCIQIPVRNTSSQVIPIKYLAAIAKVEAVVKDKREKRNSVSAISNKDIEEQKNVDKPVCSTSTKRNEKESSVVTPTKTDTNKDHINKMSNLRKGPCRHIIEEQKDFTSLPCVKCPTYYLVTETSTILREDMITTILAKICVMDDFPNLSTILKYPKYLNIYESWQLKDKASSEYWAQGGKEVKILTTKAPVFADNYVFLTIQNSHGKQFAIEKDFVIGTGSKCRKYDAMNYKIGFDQVDYLTYILCSTITVNFKPAEEKKVSLRIEGSTKHRKEWSVGGSIFFVHDKCNPTLFKIETKFATLQKFNSCYMLDVLVRNVTQNDVMMKPDLIRAEATLQIDQHLPSKSKVGASAYFNDTKHNKEDLEDEESQLPSKCAREHFANQHTYELRTINVCPLPPKQITSVIVEICGLQRKGKKYIKVKYSQEVSKTLKCLKLINSVQKIYLGRYIFVTVKNTGLGEMMLDKNTLVGHGSFNYWTKSFPITLEVDKDYALTCDENIEFDANERASVRCSLKDAPAEELNAYLSYRPSEIKGLVVKRSVGTTYWDEKSKMNYANILVENQTNDVITISVGKTVVKALSLNHDGYVSSYVKMSNDADSSSDVEMDENTGHPNVISLDDVSDTEMGELVEEENTNIHTKDISDFELTSSDEEVTTKSNQLELEEMSDVEIIETDNTKTCSSKNKWISSKCSVCNSTGINVSKKCTTCKTYPMLTISDLELQGHGSNTVLVKVFFPSDHNIKYVQTFMSNPFEHMKKKHKGLGFSRKVTRKVFLGKYVFISLSDQESLKGLIINKGFHIGDCQARPLSVYKVSVPLEISNDNFLMIIQTVGDTSLEPFGNTTIKIKIDCNIPQNKENVHQLYCITDVASSFEKLGLSVIDKTFTTVGSKTASIRVSNFRSYSQTLVGNTLIGWVKSMMNDKGVQWILTSSITTHLS